MRIPCLLPSAGVAATAAAGTTWVVEDTYALAPGQPLPDDSQSAELLGQPRVGQVRVRVRLHLSRRAWSERVHGIAE